MPSNDIARKMCLLYGDMKLAYEHLENSQVGEMVLPNLKDKDLCCSTLGFLNQLASMDKKKLEIVRIASDGIISDNEVDDWTELEHLIKGLIQSSYELLYRR